MRIREVVLLILKALERDIPPPPKCHHAITYAQYGSDESGWADRLALQVNVSGEFHCFFLDAEDFEKSPEQLAMEIKQLLATSDEQSQKGVALGQYLRSAE